MNEVRIDKWLWATRIFKTRSIAAEACKKGKVFMRDTAIKPSAMVKVGDIIKVRKPPVTFSFEVLDLTQNRVGAKLVQNFMKNVTPPEEYEALELQKLSGYIDRAKGTGRPTKKERRDLEQFIAPDDFYEWWGDESEDE